MLVALGARKSFGRGPPATMEAGDKLAANHEAWGAEEAFQQKGRFIVKVGKHHPLDLAGRRQAVGQVLPPSRNVSVATGGDHPLEDGLNLIGDAVAKGDAPVGIAPSLGPTRGLQLDPQAGENGAEVSLIEVGQLHRVRGPHAIAPAISGRDQPLAGQARQGLAHRCRAQPQSLGHGRNGQGLAGRIGALDQAFTKMTKRQANGVGL